MAGQKLSAPAPTTLAKRIPPVTCSIIVPTKATTNTALAKSLRAPKTKLSRRFRVSGDTKTPSATRWSQRYGTGGLGRRSHWKGGGKFGRFVPTKILVLGLMTNSPNVATYRSEERRVGKESRGR